MVLFVARDKKYNQRRADVRHRADINSNYSLSRPLRLRTQECLCSTRPVSKVGGANYLPVCAGCTFCHEQQKVPKNALCVTFAALAFRATDVSGRRRQFACRGVATRAATVPLTPFPAGGMCLGRQSRFARMTQGPVIRVGAGKRFRLIPTPKSPWDLPQVGRRRVAAPEPGNSLARASINHRGPRSTRAKRVERGSNLASRG